MSFSFTKLFNESDEGDEKSNGDAQRPPEGQSLFTPAQPNQGTPPPTPGAPAGNSPFTQDAASPAESLSPFSSAPPLEPLPEKPAIPGLAPVGGQSAGPPSPFSTVPQPQTQPPATPFSSAEPPAQADPADPRFAAAPSMPLPSSASPFSSVAGEGQEAAYGSGMPVERAPRQGATESVFSQENPESPFSVADSITPPAPAESASPFTSVSPPVQQDAVATGSPFSQMEAPRPEAALPPTNPGSPFQVDPSLAPTNPALVPTPSYQAPAEQQSVPAQPAAAGSPAPFTPNPGIPGQAKTVLPERKAAPSGPPADDRIQLGLRSILTGVSPQHLGVDPNTISPEEQISLDLISVKAQIGTGKVLLTIDDIRSGVAPALVPMFTNANPNLQVKVPLQDVFHQLPSEDGSAAPGAPTPAIPPAFETPFGTQAAADSAIVAPQLPYPQSAVDPVIPASPVTSTPVSEAPAPAPAVANPTAPTYTAPFLVANPTVNPPPASVEVQEAPLPVQPEPPELEPQQAAPQSSALNGLSALTPFADAPATPAEPPVESFSEPELPAAPESSLGVPALAPLGGTPAVPPAPSPFASSPTPEVSADPVSELPELAAPEIMEPAAPEPEPAAVQPAEPEPVVEIETPEPIVDEVVAENIQPAHEEVPAEPEVAAVDERPVVDPVPSPFASEVEEESAPLESLAIDEPEEPFAPQSLTAGDFGLPPLAKVEDEVPEVTAEEEELPAAEVEVDAEPEPDAPEFPDLNPPSADVSVEEEAEPEDLSFGYQDNPSQLALRAVFGSDETFTGERVVQHCQGLEGIESALLLSDGGTVGGVDDQFGAAAPNVYDRVRGLAQDLGLAEDTQTITLRTDRGIMSFFSHDEHSLAVLHKDPSFLPGVREKLILVSRELGSLIS